MLVLFIINSNVAPKQPNIKEIYTNKSFFLRKHSLIYEKFVYLHHQIKKINLMNTDKLTPQEENVLQILWTISDGTVKDILTATPETQRQPYTTVASVIKNLERKQYVTSRKVGNTYLYTPSVRREDYKRSSLNRLIDNYFGGSYRNLVSFFVKEEKLKPEELQELIQIIQRGNNT